MMCCSLDPWSVWGLPSQCCLKRAAHHTPIDRGWLPLRRYHSQGSLYLPLAFQAIAESMALAPHRSCSPIWWGKDYTSAHSPDKDDRKPLISHAIPSGPAVGIWLSPGHPLQAGTSYYLPLLSEWPRSLPHKGRPYYSPPAWPHRTPAVQRGVSHPAVSVSIDRPWASGAGPGRVWLPCRSSGTPCRANFAWVGLGGCIGSGRRWSAAAPSL